MRFFKYLLAAGAIFAMTAFVPSTTPKAEAQVSFGITVGHPIGVEPGCPWGYYGYAPYRCAPEGYYGPDWFNGGVFVGAGPWFRGGYGFAGRVNRAYDPRYGYHGAYPHPGPYRGGDFHNFHGNDYHNYSGNHVYGRGDDHGYHDYHGDNHAYDHGHH